jgi:hypothetical protein
MERLALPSPPNVAVHNGLTALKSLERLNANKKAPSHHTQGFDGFIG